MAEWFVGTNTHTGDNAKYTKYCNPFSYVHPPCYRRRCDTCPYRDTCAGANPEPYKVTFWSIN